MYKISIIMPIFNTEKYIERSFKSILNQTMDLNDIEVIMVDDCSTDKTCEIVQTFSEKDPRIKLLRQEKNAGAGAARTRAMRASTGRFIAYLDADDIWIKFMLIKKGVPVVWVKSRHSMPSEIPGTQNGALYYSNTDKFNSKNDRYIQAMEEHFNIHMADYSYRR